MTNDMLENWAAGLVNAQGVKGPFGGILPPLDRVRLVQLVVNDTNDLSISINLLNGLPASSPEQWRTKGYDTVQIRFSFFDVSEVSFKQQVILSKDVSVEMSRKSVRLRGIGSSIALDATFGGVKAEVCPFRDAEYDGPVRAFNL